MASEQMKPSIWPARRARQKAAASMEAELLREQLQSMSDRLWTLENLLLQPPGLQGQVMTSVDRDLHTKVDMILGMLRGSYSAAVKPGMTSRTDETGHVPFLAWCCMDTINNVGNPLQTDCETPRTTCDSKILEALQPEVELSPEKFIGVAVEKDTMEEEMEEDTMEVAKEEGTTEEEAAEEGTTEAAMEEDTAKAAMEGGTMEVGTTEEATEEGATEAARETITTEEGIMEEATEKGIADAAMEEAISEWEMEADNMKEVKEEGTAEAANEEDTMEEAPKENSSKRKKKNKKKKKDSVEEGGAEEEQHEHREPGEIVAESVRQALENAGECNNMEKVVEGAVLAALEKCNLEEVMNARFHELCKLRQAG